MALASVLAATTMDPKRLRALAEFIPKGAAPKVRNLGAVGGVLAVLGAPMVWLFYNSLYNGMWCKLRFEA